MTRSSTSSKTGVKGTSVGSSMGISMASVPLSTKNARSDVSVDELDELVDLRDLDDLDEVGDFFVKYSQPEKIVNIYESSDDFEVKNHQKLLHVNVAPAAALEFQHFQNKIIEKINSFFGYKAIHYIKIHQNFTSKNTYNSPKIIDKFDNNFLNQKKKEIKDTTQKINDKELGQSLLNLGFSITKNEPDGDIIKSVFVVFLSTSQPVHQFVTSVG